MSWQILEGDVEERLADLDSASVQTVVTSPPYWGLRDYGIEGQLGLEATPEQYVGNLVAVFREVRRVLRDDGTLWLNLGDSYNAYNGNRGTESEYAGRRREKGEPEFPRGRGLMTGMLKPKDLIGIPWRVAFALQADGWWLRSDIIWSKPNPMPESVTDRPTRAHEYLFLLSKNARYFYDADAIREPHSRDWGDGKEGGSLVNGASRTDEFALSRGAAWVHRGDNPPQAHPMGANKRSVWIVTTQPYPEAHFILAGSRPYGALIEPEVIETPLGERNGDDPSLVTGRAGMNRPRHPDEGRRPITRQEQVGYAAQLRASPARGRMEAEAGEAFAHYLRTDASGARPIPPVLLDDWIDRGWLDREAVPTATPADPATSVVLDPFCGSGTTGLVALRHERSFIGIELNSGYCELARNRIRDDAPLLNAHLEAA